MEFIPLLTLWRRGIPYRTKIRRTKVSKFQLGVENFVRRNILSVENFVQYFNTKLRHKLDKTVEISAWCRTFWSTKYFVRRKFCPKKFCLYVHIPRKIKDKSWWRRYFIGWIFQPTPQKCMENKTSWTKLYPRQLWPMTLLRKKF